MTSSDGLKQRQGGVAAIWCRVSTHDQRELSLESQEIAVRKTLEAQLYQVPLQYVLRADWSSLDLMSCPDFRRLLRWIAEGTVQAVGTLDRDRRQAQGLQRLVFLSECQERGVRVVNVQGPPMLEGAEGQLVELALALGKERSVLRAQQGAKDGLRDRALLKGLPPNMSQPYGMRWQNSRLVPDENYPIACEIWSMGLAKRKIMAIAGELTRRGILTPKGKVEWSSFSVRHILKNRTYAGVIEALKTESVEPKARKRATYGKSGRRVRPEDQRIRLEGLVERPIITKGEFDWMQQRLLANQRQAQRNTVHNYLLKGLIHCTDCGGTYGSVTLTRRGKVYAYYICRNRSKPGPNRERCQSATLRVDEQERAVFAAAVNFLHSPEGFESEMQRRRGITIDTEISLRRELESLGRQQQEEQEAEAKAFRLASRTNVSEEVFNQEVGLIRTRQRWIQEQRQRVQAQLSDVERFSFSAEAIAQRRNRLDARLAGATVQDRRFVLEALDTNVMVHADGSWELELQVPRQIVAPEEVLPIVNDRPGSNCTVIHI